MNPRVLAGGCAAVLLAALAAPKPSSGQPPAPAPDAQARPDVPVEQSAAMRNPFWPVGYTPAATPTGTPAAVAVPAGATPAFAVPAGPPREEDWNEARRLLQFGGVSSRAGGPMFAVVSGRVVAAGDFVEAPYRGWVFAWRVQRVDASGIELVRAADRVRRAGAAAEPAAPPGGARKPPPPAGAAAGDAPSGAEAGVKEENR
jgi:hypothetical protein